MVDLGFYFYFPYQIFIVYRDILRPSIHTVVLRLQRKSPNIMLDLTKYIKYTLETRYVFIINLKNDKAFLQVFYLYFIVYIFSNFRPIKTIDTIATSYQTKQFCLLSVYV